MASIQVNLSQINLHELFSQLNKYSWNFTVGNNPTSISCVSLSVDEARCSILNFLSNIEMLTMEYKQCMKDKKYDEAKKIRYSFPAYHDLDANLDIGGFTKDIFDYHLKMSINYSDEDTLGHFIATTEPNVQKFKLVSVFSYLDS